MSRSLTFGRNGESEWQRLEATLQLEQRGAYTLVVSDNRECLDEARRRVESIAPVVTAITPDKDAMSNIENIARASEPGSDGIPVAWIDASIHDPENTEDVWREALAALNRGRDHLHDLKPILVVLAGPRRLETIIARRAPDLRNVLDPGHIDLGDEVEIPVQSVEPLNWLHLSDLHIEKSWQQDIVLKNLIRDLPALMKQAEVTPSLLFVTGDIARFGKADEYDIAERFFETLLEKLSLTPKQLFMVPGNHDVDQTTIRRIVKRDQDAILKLEGDRFRDEIGEILGSRDDCETYIERMTRYREFTDRLLGARGMAPDRMWRTDIHRQGALDVGIASLCSSWMCRPHEGKYGEIVLGERQVREALDELSHAAVRIVLLHHPISWLHSAERGDIDGLLRKEADLLLHGHQHDTSAEMRQTSKNACVYLEAGAVYTSSPWPLGFQLGALDTAKKELTCRFFTWSQKDGGFWHVNNGVGADASDGKARFSLTLPDIADSKEPITGSAGLAERIRKATVKVCSRHGFIGIPADAAAGSGKATLANLYVPLAFTVRNAVGESDDRIKLKAIEHRLYENRQNADEFAGTTPRYLVLGGPGSGKTTLIQYLAVSAACHQAGLVPVRIVLREYLRQGAVQSLLAFAAKEISDLLAVSTSEQALVAFCTEGRVLLLVDGLDEVASPDERERVRDMIAALADAYPKTPVIVTSRITGYEQAPLDDWMFEHFLLAPFDDDQLSQFISNWYNTVETESVRERDRKKADLEAALVAEPRAKELARNPLFATLIALVHRFEASLPGERAKLFELCIRMLLETWPKSTRRRFELLDEGKQRSILEQLALVMQRERVDKHLFKSDITVDRDTLENQIVELLGQREMKDMSRPERAHVARQWIDWLKAGTGILVEQQPGVFGFLHLSILEYLAGQALLDELMKDGVEKVADFVSDNHVNPSWQETLLLMIGSRATERHLVDAVIEKLLSIASDTNKQWRAILFMLQILREEADLTQAHKERLLNIFKHAVLIGASGDWDTARQRLTELVRFSKRHGAWLVERLTTDLETATGNSLLGAVALTPGELNPNQILNQRKDLCDLLPYLLDYWTVKTRPRVDIDNINPQLTLDWAIGIPLHDIHTRCETSLVNKFAIAAAVMTAAIARRMIYLGEFEAVVAGKNRNTDLGYMKPGIPAITTWQAGDLEWMTHQAFALTNDESAVSFDPWSISLPFHESETILNEYRNGGRFGSRMDWYDEFDPWFLVDRGNSDYDFVLSTSNRSGNKREIATGPINGQLSIEGISADKFHDYLRAFGTKLDRRGKYPSTQFFKQFAEEIEGTLTLKIGDKYPSPFSISCPWDHPDTGIPPMLGKYYSEILVGFHLAAVMGLSHDQCVSVAACRAQNFSTWLYLDRWAQFPTKRAVDVGSTADKPWPPEYHALLLALGLSAYQTLWMWPWGEHWKQLAEGDVPSHYLPAHFWRLCAAAREPEQQDFHLAEAEKCLDRSDWPKLAAILRENMVRPTPKGVLDLFTYGDPSSDV